jgi:hypothetical protein
MKLPNPDADPRLYLPLPFEWNERQLLHDLQRNYRFLHTNKEILLDIYIYI